MTGLPPKPEASRPSTNSWSEPSDDRRYGNRSAPMAAPDHYRPRRDDRERDRDRDRSYHPPRSPPPRSPLRGRESSYDTRKDSHRSHYDSYHPDERSRGERGWEPGRRGQDRRDDRPWAKRDEYPGRGQGRGWDRGRGSPRRGYDNDSWRGRDSERDWDRDRDRNYSGRGRSRDYDRNHYDRRKFDDRERPSMRRPPYSPRRDSRERRSRTRSPSRHSLSPRRHSRPLSPDGSIYRPSSRSPAKHEGRHSPMPRGRYPEHREARSRSPRHLRQPSLSKDIKAEPRDEKPILGSPSRSVHNQDEKQTLPISPRVKAEPDDNEFYHHEVQPTPDGSSSSRVKEEPVTDQDADRDFKMHDRSLTQDLQIRSHSPSHTISAPVKAPSTPISPARSLRSEEASAEIPKPPTAPYLPSFPKRQSAKERLGSKYREELSQIEAMEAIRTRAAAEHLQISKAVRRALHELDLTTMDLRAAQSRREHAENHRKKAAAGFLDMEAEFCAAP